MKAMVAIVAVWAFATAASASESAVKVGNWEVITIQDPIDDSTRAVAILSGEGGSLAIKCDKPGQDSLYVQFISKRYLGNLRSSYSSRDFTYRIDTDAPVTEGWAYEKSSALQFNRKIAYPLLDRLATANKIAIRASTYDYSTVDASFDLDGVGEAISLTRSTCQSR